MELTTEKGPDVEIYKKHTYNPKHKTWDERDYRWEPRTANNVGTPLDSTSRYRQPIKPKEEKMEEPRIVINTKYYQASTSKITLTLEEAEKAGERSQAHQSRDSQAGGDTGGGLVFSGRID
jgi:hypothetical protein